MSDQFEAFRRERLLTLEKLDAMRTIPADSQIVTSNGFKEALLNNELVIDRSMLIEEIINKQRVVVTYPRRWGKTLNMQMVKAFFETELDQRGAPVPKELCVNRRLFEMGGFDENGNRRPMKIMQRTDLVNEYMGKYIVVHLTMNLSGSTCDQIVQNLSRAVLDLFKQFEFLGSKLSHVYQAWFNSHLDLTFLQQPGNLRRCLEFLCGVIYNHYFKKIVILVDAYDYTSDYIFQNFVESHEAHKIAELIIDMLGLAIKDKDYLEFSMFTGVLNLAKDWADSPCDMLKFYTLTDSNFSAYYGFTDTEVDCLFQVLGLDQTHRVMLRNNGYTFNSQVAVYNPWSVANFINTWTKNRSQQQNSLVDAFKSYLTISGIEFVQPLMIQPAVMRKFGEMLGSSNKTEFNFQSISKEQMICLRRQIEICKNGSNIYFDVSSEDINVLFSYLTFHGYLSVKSYSWAGRCVVTFSNLEVQRDIMKMIHSEIGSGFKAYHTDQVGKCIQQFIQSDNKTKEVVEQFTSNLAGFFEEFIADLPYFAQFDQFDLRSSKSYVHCLLTALFLGQLEINSLDRLLETEVSDLGRGDIFFTYSDLAIIFELKYNESALQQIHEKAYYINIKPHFTYLCLLGLNVNSDKSVQVRTQLVHKDLVITCDS